VAETFERQRATQASDESENILLGSIPPFAARILKRQMKIAVCFDFHCNHAHRNGKPFIFNAGTL
jgi:hypothetical protein